MDRTNKDVRFLFNYQGKKYGFAVEGESLGYIDPASGKESIQVILPQEKTEKLLNSLFDVIDRQRNIKGR